MSQVSVGISFSERKSTSEANHIDRRGIAATPYIISHEQEKRNSTKAQSNTECAHIFLHPMKWMRPSMFPSKDGSDSYTDGSGEAPLSGRLMCPNTACGANIGKFAWQGMPCNCGHWVTPAIGLARARVDIANKVNVARGPGSFLAGMGIRTPPGMRAPAASDPGSGRGNL